MDKEPNLHFIDEKNISIFNEDYSKSSHLQENLPNNYNMSSVSALRPGQMNAGKKQIGYNKDILGHNDWDWMNCQRTISQEKLKDYLFQLSQYLRQHNPELMNVFQNENLDYDEDRGRSTPLQFSDYHVILKLDFPGIMYQLVPHTIKHEGGVILISDDIFPKSYEFQYDDYPGPLTLEKTTEDQIYSYLKDQMSIELQDTSPIDWDSGYLLINYLELMIKENGKPRVGNIVRLLNEGVETKTADLQKESKISDVISRNSFSRCSSRATSRASSRPSSPTNVDSIDSDLPQNSVDIPRGPGSVASVFRRAVVNVSSDQKLCQNMDRYRQYIMTGRFEEAVHFATKSGIWDHAFALALRMNNTQLINEVLVSFSRRAIYSNDPLFTMHELMAQKLPKITAANRGFSNSEMGDWRCHLGMILAVRKFRPEDCRKAIESMGEKLSALRSYYAAHLCYLLAGTQFGLDRNSVRYRRKFDLIGWQSSTSSIPAQKSSFANCNKLFTGLQYWNSAPEQCIKLTEVYEYALRLANDSYHESLSVHLLPYKYLMVYKMLSKNQVKNAYEYCVSIGHILGYQVNWLQCESINFRIISNIRNLSYRLNSWLTVHEDSDYVHQTTHWLANIDRVYCLFCDKYKLWNPNFMKPDFSESKCNDDESCGNNQSLSENSLMSSNFTNNGPDYQEHVSGQMYHNDLSYQRRQSHHSNRDNSFSLSRNNQDSLNQSINSRVPPVSQNRISNQPNFGQRQPEFSEHTVSNSGQSHHRLIKPAVVTRPIDNYSGSVNLNSSQNTAMIQNSSANRMRFESNTFREIAPPSELPNEAIMTEPPKFADPKTIDRDQSRLHNINAYDSHRLRLENSMKAQMNKLPFSSSSSDVDSTKFLPTTNQFSNNKLGDPAGHSGDSNCYRVPTSAYHNQQQFSQQPQLAPQASSPPPPLHVSEETSSVSKILPKGTFVPALQNDDDDSRVDCFTSYTSRSRSQSNGSVGSYENPTKPYGGHHRSRNTSESKDFDGFSNHPSQSIRTVVESTKEEVELTTNTVSAGDEKVSEKSESSDVATKQKSAWSFLNILKSSRPKEIYLPNDNEKSMVYDTTKNKWVDKSDPDSEKPLTPPPMMPAFVNPTFQSSIDPSSSPYQQSQIAPANQFVKSRYRAATQNVKPSTGAVIPPPNPTFNILPRMSDGGFTTSSYPDSAPGYSQAYNYNSSYGQDRNAAQYQNTSEHLINSNHINSSSMTTNQKIF